MLFLYQCLQVGGCLFICKEMYPATEHASHPAEMFHPTGKAGFIFCFRWDGNDNPFKRVNRYQEFGNNKLTVQSFQQVYGKYTEKRIRDVCLVVQPGDNACYLILFGGMDNAGSDILVITGNLSQRDVDRCCHHSRFFQITFAPHSQIVGSVIIIDYIDCQ